MHWRKVTLVGVGLLGGSLGLALRRRGLADSIVGYVRRSASIPECRECGAVDVATCDLLEAVAGAQLVVLCTPLGEMTGLAEQMSPVLKRGAIVTDVGSVKGSVVSQVGRIIARVGAHFVGSHPMAGSEKTGVAAAREDLFANAVTVVTPTPSTHPAALRRVGQLWKSVGSRVLKLSPAIHDELVSRSSHLPHLLAAALANFVLSPRFPNDQAALCANGFRDTTRIASGSPVMWRDISVGNGRQIARALRSLIKELQRLEGLIQQGDSAAIEALLCQAKQRRDDWQKVVHPGSPE